MTPKKKKPRRGGGDGDAKNGQQEEKGGGTLAGEYDTGDDLKRIDRGQDEAQSNVL